MEQSKNVWGVLLGLGLLGLVGCGGAETEEAPLPSLSTAPTVERRLILDLSDAELLYSSSSLRTAKEAEAVAPTSEYKELDGVLLQKITADSHLKPALYIEKTTHLSTPVSTPGGTADSASPEKTQSSSGQDPVILRGTSESINTMKIVDTGTLQKIVLDDVVTDIANVITTPSDTFLQFEMPFSYNGGSRCGLFQIVETNGLKCVDANLDWISTTATDRAGDLFYEAVTNTGTVLRKRAAADGTVSDMAALDRNKDGGISSWRLMPNGTLLFDLKTSDGSRSFKKLDGTGESTVTIKKDNPAATASFYSLAKDGSLLLRGYDKRDVIYKVAFGADATPSLHFDSKTVDGLSSIDSTFYLDNEDNHWIMENINGVKKLVEMDPVPNASSSREKASNPISNIIEGGNLYFTVTNENKTTSVLRISSASGAVKEEVFFESDVPNNLFGIRIGNSGKVYFVVDRLSDGKPVYGYKNDAGNLVWKVLSANNYGGYAVYSLQ